jgi:hypothetical protein
MPTDPKFDPSKPLDDKDDEESTVREAKARARLKYLQENDYKYEPATPQPAAKKRKGIFAGRD